jgi:iron complex transport system substrate-binding protein
MLEIAGAVNVFADHEGWLGVSDETLLVLNPDVILTSTNFLDDAIADITDRPGWDVITAVRNGDVFYIDANSSSRPSHNIIKALREITRAVYPELFPDPRQ